jgi:hypothetical protein
MMLSPCITLMWVSPSTLSPTYGPFGDPDRPIWGMPCPFSASYGDPVQDAPLTASRVRALGKESETWMTWSEGTGVALGFWP